MDAFWQAGIEAGYRDDGAPGPRAVYGPDYYGGFLLDPDGNSAEAVHTERQGPRARRQRRPPLDSCPRRRGVQALLHDDRPARRAADRRGRLYHVQLVGENFSFSLIDDERPLTENVHLAFPAHDDATVRAFHAAALAAGYEDHGGPGERPAYHPGYYGAFVLDPDGNQRRGRQPQPLSRCREAMVGSAHRVRATTPGDL